MTNPYRALCAELADALVEWQLGGGPPEDTADADLIDRARALLAKADGPAVPDGREPASVALQPSDGEVAELVKWLHRRAAEVQAENCTTIYSPHLRRVADLLAQRHPAPVPTSERPWERDGWCDAEGRCYGWDGDYWWMVGNPGAARETIAHWLPAHSLPTPEAL